jgi:hypothetical protein
MNNEFCQAHPNAARGYMMNAAIDLETGTSKATALRTLNGGIDRIAKTTEGWDL